MNNLKPYRAAKQLGADTKKKSNILPLNHIMLALVLALPTLASTSLSAQPAETAASAKQTQHYKISAGPLNKVLAQFAKTSGVLIAGSNKLAQGKTSQGINGKYTIEKALSILFTGTGLQAVKQKDSSYRVVTVNEKIMTLATTQVSDFQETATSPVNGYFVKQSATATKTDTPMMEITRSISVINADSLTVRKVQDLATAVAYTPGIIGSGAAAGRPWDVFNMRGFGLNANNILRDGLQSRPKVSNGQIEPYGLERLEVLKGAASVLYGASSPGGIVNGVSKRPYLNANNEINVSLGSFNHKQISVDFADNNNDENLLYRMVGLYRDSDHFVDLLPNDRLYLAPSFSWQVSDATSLTLLAEYQKDDSGWYDELPLEGTYLNNPNGKLPRNRNVRDSGNKDQREQSSVTILLNHKFTDQLTLNHGTRYFKNDVDIIGTEFWWQEDEQGEMDFRTLERFSWQDDVSAEILHSDTSLQLKLTHGNFEHTILTGVDYLDSTETWKSYDLYGTNNIDAFLPVYGQVDFSELEKEVWDGSWKNKTTALGFYLQDQIKFSDQWIASIALRHDNFELTETEIFQQPSQPYSEKSNATTGSAGLLYLADNGIAPYLSYSQSFEPTAGTDKSGKRFEPTEGEQLELGFRYQPESGDWQLSSSVYQLVQSNVLTTDLSNDRSINERYKIQLGEVTSKGFELEINGQLSENLQIIAGYAYNDTRTTKSNLPNELDKHAYNAPKNQLSTWLDYSFSVFNLNQVNVGIGARYIDDIPTPSPEITTPSYTLIDTMVSYSLAQWQLSLNVSNLTDKEYFGSCNQRGCTYGEPRRVTLSASFNF